MYKGSRNSAALSTSFEHQRLIRQQAQGQAKILRLRQELAQPRYALIQSQSIVVTQNETKSGSQAGIQDSEPENEFQDDLDSLQRSLEAPRDSLDRRNRKILKSQYVHDVKAGDTVLLNSVRTSTDIIANEFKLRACRERGKAQASSIETTRADALLVFPLDLVPMWSEMKASGDCCGFIITKESVELWKVVSHGSFQLNKDKM